MTPLKGVQGHKFMLYIGIAFGLFLTINLILITILDFTDHPTN